MTMDYDNDIKREFCFLFYVSSKEVVSRFNQYLKQYDISFPNFIVLQYIEDKIRLYYIKTLCDELFLDSGTISPIIKRLEKKNLIKRRRTEEDERRVKVHLN
jgi:DNA-binding MarR family transcriptional regulator